MTYPFAVPVTWITRAKSGTDAYGDDQFAETPTATSAVFAPGGSSELTNGGDVVITQPTLYGVDASLAVKATDVFVVAGVRFEVDGDPQQFQPSPFSGWVTGLVVKLRKVTG